MKSTMFLLTILALAVSAGCEKSPTTDKPVAAAPDPEVGQTSQQPPKAHAHDHAGEPDKAPKPTKAPNKVAAADDNPVKQEMQLLTIAMKNSLDAIAANQLERIPNEIHQVHPAKLRTEAAVKAGTYKAPQNGDKMADFAKLDEAFHNDLRALLSASQSNNAPAAAAAYGKLVEGCVGCHAQFRFPAAKP